LNITFSKHAQQQQQQQQQQQLLLVHHHSYAPTAVLAFHS
jgi:hypothetical protein